MNTRALKIALCACAVRTLAWSASPSAENNDGAYLPTRQTRHALCERTQTDLVFHRGPFRDKDRKLGSGLQGEKMKRFLNMLFLLVLSAFIYGHSSTASAVTVYTSEADFGAALDSFYLEEFNDLVGKTGSSAPLERGPVNGFSYTITAGEGTLYRIDSGAISTNGPAESLVFNFTGDSVTAFGGFLWPTDYDLNNQVAGMDRNTFCRWRYRDLLHRKCGFRYFYRLYQ